MSYTHKKGYWRYAVFNHNIKGLESFDKMLAGLSDAITNEVLLEEFTELAKTTAEIAKENCISWTKEGRSTGRLAKGYKWTPARIRKDGTVKSTTYNQVFYASFVEFGTSRSASKPILRSAAVEATIDLGKRLSKRTEKVISKLLSGGEE